MFLNLYVSVKEMNVIDVYEINHIIRTAEMKSNESQCLEQAILLQGLVLLELKAGLEITAGQRTMSGLIGELTSQLFVLPVMLTGHNRSYSKHQYVASRCALRNVDLESWVKYNYNRCLQFAH